MKNNGSRLAALVLSAIIVGESIYSPLTAMGSVYATEVPASEASLEEVSPVEVSSEEGLPVEAIEAGSDEQNSETAAEKETTADEESTENREGNITEEQDIDVESEEDIADGETGLTEESQTETADAEAEEILDTWTDEQGNVYTFAGYETNENGDSVPVYNVMSAVQTRKEAHGQSVRVAKKFYATAPKSADYYRLYYNQINETEKKIYKGLESEYQKLLENPNETIIVSVCPSVTINVDWNNNALQPYFNMIFQAIAAFCYDHPEAFWLDAGDFGASLSRIHEDFDGDGKNEYVDKFIITKAENSTDFLTDVYEGNVNTVKADQIKIDNAIQDIINKIPENGTIYEKTAVINDWLANFNYYNRYVQKNYYPVGIENKLTNGHTAVAALTEQTWLKSKDDYGDPLSPVCESYAKAFKLVCDRIGIPCIVVSGANHMWNYVQDVRNGKWYGVDVTWDDPVRDAEWENKITPSYWIHEYLLVGANTNIDGSTFLSRHPANGAFWVGGQPFDTPTLEADAYADSVIITFDPQGGSFANGVPSNIETKFEAQLPELPTPTKEGYEFLGWYTAANGLGYTVKAGDTVNQKSDYTLYAHWKPSVIEVTFDSNGGNIVETALSLKIGQNYGTLPSVARAGYTFQGWYTTIDGDIKISKDSKVTKTNDHVLYAHWTPNEYTLTFDPQGGIVTEKTRKITSDAQYGQLPEATKEGHTFLGWYTDKTGGTEVKEDTKVERYENHSLYAHWEPNTYTVSFITNTETGESERYIKYGREFGSLPELNNKTGYDFIGWREEDSQGKLITESDIVTKDVKLWADWSPKQFNVTLDVRGGNVSKSEFLVEYDATFDGLEIPVYPGKIFAGWYDDNGNLVQPDYEVKILNDIILYAKWDERATDAPSIEISDNKPKTEGSIYASSKIKISGMHNSLTYYTLNGKEPDRNNLHTEDNPNGTTYLYEEEFVIGDIIGYDQQEGTTVTIKAISYRDGYNPSGIEKTTYTLEKEPEDWGDLEEYKGEFEGLDQIPEGFWVRGLEEKSYTGKAITQNNLEVFYGKNKLEIGTDCTIKYSNNVKAGDAVITITGKGSYTGVWKTSFEIKPLDISKAILTPDRVVLAYNKKVQKATTSVKYNIVQEDGTEKTVTLKSGTDFTYEYTSSDYKSVGAHTVIIKGKGNYDPNTQTQFTEHITDCVPVNKLSITIKGGSFNGGAEIEPATVTVKSGKTVLTGKKIDVAKAEDIQTIFTGEYSDYDYVYYLKNNNFVGKAEAVFIGNESKGYMGEITKTYDITGMALSKAIFDKGVTTSVGWQPKEGDNNPNEKNLDEKVLQYTINNQKEPLKGILSSEYKSKYIDEGKTLSEEALTYDYTYEYDGDTSKPGTVKIKFTGINRFTGVVNKSYKITGTAMSKVKIEGVAASYVYTGEAIWPAGMPDEDMPEGVCLYIPATKTTERVELTKLKDFEVSYQKNVNVGTATIVFTGINGYTGTLKKTFKITAYNILTDTEGSIEVEDIPEQPYTKGGVTPEVTVRFAGATEPLVVGKDYTVKYSNNTKQGTAKVTITGKGNFSKAITKEFNIIPSSLDVVSISINDVVAKKNTANICKPKIVLTDTNNKVLTAGTDYSKTIEYTYTEDVIVKRLEKKAYKEVGVSKDTPVDPKDIIEPGTLITAKITGMGNYADSIEEQFRFVKNDISKMTVTIPAQLYTGHEIRLVKDQIVVKNGKEILGKTDYRIDGYLNNVNKGTATVILAGEGIYGGTKKATFKINARSLDTVVNFHSNYPNGAKEVVRTQKIQGDAAALSANAFKATGAVFVGWSTAPIEASTQKNEVVYVDKANVNVKEKDFKGETIDLYAVWQLQKYTITYMNMDGVGKNPNPETYTVLDDTISLSAELERNGYSFLGWYKDAKFKTKITQIKKGSTGNITLYAKWSEKGVALLFDANGGQGVMAKIPYIKYGSSITLPANTFSKPDFFS